MPVSRLRCRTTASTARWPSCCSSTSFFTDNFLQTGNLRTQLVQVAPVVIVALGMALVIGSEGVDLSVGSVMALAAAVIPLYLGLRRLAGGR